MKNINIIGTVLFILYLIAVFCLFFNDKKLLAVFSSIGVAVYVIFYKKYVDNEKDETK